MYKKISIFAWILKLFKYIIRYLFKGKALKLGNRPDFFVL